MQFVTLARKLDFSSRFEGFWKWRLESHGSKVFVDNELHFGRATWVPQIGFQNSKIAGSARILEKVSAKLLRLAILFTLMANGSQLT